MEIQTLAIVIMAISAAALLIIAANVDLLCRDLRASLRSAPLAENGARFSALPTAATPGEVRFHFPPSMFPDRPIVDDQVPK